MPADAAPIPPVDPPARRPRPAGRDLVAGARSAVTAVGEAFANDGIRRLGISWTIGIAADAALTVVTLVTVFNRGGVLAAGLLGAVRLIPAIAVGMVSGALVERFRGHRILVVVGLVRAASAVLTALALLTAGSTMADHEVTMIQLFILAAIAAAAAAPVRPTQIILMPAIARSPAELVAANTAWTTGEGLGAFVGPAIAGGLMSVNLHAAAAAVAGIGFALTALIAAGLRFEQVADAAGGSRRSAGRGFRFLDGLRAVRRSPVLAWTMIGTYGQVITRGLLNALVVVAAIDLLGMGQSGPGLLSAALGIGGLVGILFAMSSTRSDRLVRTEILALVFWGLPLAAIGIAPLAPIAVAAMVVIGVANATYDVALFTILQRGSTNEDRAPILSVLEVVIGLGGISGSLLAPLFTFGLGPRGALMAGGAILPAIALLMERRIGREDHVVLVNEDLVELLRAVPAFAALPMTAVERVAAGLVPFAAPAGTALMTQGDLGDAFEVIATGEIEVLVDGRPIHRLGPGAGVGEIALLRRGPRTATVVAISDVTGFRVDAATFLAAVAGPAAAAITERMADANLQRAAATTGATA
ncbi:MAG: MFS transporter [Candidatus Limnocylindrales bacterium]